MNAEEYNEQQQAITAGLVALVMRLLEPFRAPALSEVSWDALLAALYIHVEQARREAAELGRRFYDSQRAQHANAATPHPIYLAEYEPAWFEEAMKPAKKAMMKPGASEDAVSQLVMRVAKEVENGGRRTILRPIQDEDMRDPEVKGWARVATGRETCGFCMMMVSRGAVYLSAENAGLDADDTTAEELWRQGDEAALNELMTRWHPGCDCKVVPVFDRKNWAGRDAYLRAEKLWIEATRGYRGKDALNALRRALDDGEVDSTDFAVAA